MIELEIHSNRCKGGCSSWVRSDIQYGYKPYRLLVNRCLISFNGLPHTEVLDIAIPMIKKTLSEEFDKSSTEIYGHKTCGYFSDIQKYREKDEVVEMVKEGTWGYTYYVIHNMRDLDINRIVKESLQNNWLMVKNVTHLLKTKGRVVSAVKYNKNCMDIMGREARIRKIKEKAERKEENRLFRLKEKEWEEMDKARENN